ncbi:spermidine synthase [Actinoplanes sp. NBRC 103695]|uniref:spermidine synthase n=1 Tax=Actinoplanes sp. NBRC 103695 TaxID=3032202 RepID=UPI0024A48F26|nr:spermidine synthase [Actinoplanes sp. NBRC 103695]GLY95918.1 spermidine synthase [Actinoplanes sp. NBRC 103695]
MHPRLTELDWAATRIGEISLRRRLEPLTRTEVYEVKLGDEYLMSSMFTVAEEELSRLTLAALPDAPLDAVVGGLGLGYTARTALTDDRVRSLTVVEALAPVIDWHRRELLPEAGTLTTDPRTTLLEGDFFALLRDGTGFDPAAPDRRFDAILLDIDHSPVNVLDATHADLYTATGLARLAGRLRPGGAFGLWSDDAPDESFLALLRQGFATATAHVVTFANPLTGGTSANTVYVATVAAE